MMLEQNTPEAQSPAGPLLHNSIGGSNQEQAYQDSSKSLHSLDYISTHGALHGSHSSQDNDDASFAANGEFW